MLLTKIVWLLLYTPSSQQACTAGDVTPVSTLTQTSFSYNAYSGDQTLNSDPLFFFNDANSCGATSCAVKTTLSGSTASSTYFSASSSGILTVKTNGGALSGISVFLRCSHALHSSQDSQPVTVTISGTCADVTTISHPSGNVGSYTTELTSNQYDAQTASQTTSTSGYWRINWPDSSPSVCSISDNKFYLDSTYTTEASSSAVTYKSYKSSGYLRLIIDISTGTISFWWKVVFVDGSEKNVDYNGNYMFGIYSCTITQGSYQSPYSDVQQVQASDADSSQPTYFVLPAYSSSCSSQTLTRTSVGSSTANPVETSPASGIYKVVPTSISTNQELNIVVKITLSGGKEQTFGTGTYKLQVGCQSAWVTMTPSPSLVTSISQNYAIHDYVYTYINPTASPSYCAVVSNAIIDISPSGPTITVSNQAVMYKQTTTSSLSWSEQQAYAVSKGMRLLTSGEAIAKMNGADGVQALYPGANAWAPVTHNSNQDWIQVGDSSPVYNTGDLWSVCCSTDDSTWQDGTPTTGADWQMYYWKRGSMLLGAYSTDNTIVKFDQSTISQAFTFKVQSTDSAGNKYNSVDITFNALSCNDMSGILEYQGTQNIVINQDIYDNTLKNCGGQTCRVNQNSGNAPNFPILTFTSMQSNCNNIKYECFDETGTSLSSTLEQVDLEDGTKTCSPKISAGLDIIPAQYNFRVKITNQDGGHEVWLHNLKGIDHVTLNLVCNSYSNIITVVQTGSFTATQTVSKTDPKFYLPTYTQSNLNCPITAMTAGTPTQYEGTTGMNNPDISDLTFIQPVNPNVDGSIAFRIWFITTGSSSYWLDANQYVLNVGCLSTVQATYALKSTVQLEVDTKSNLINHALPTLDQSSCSINQVSIEEVTVSGTSNSSALAFPSGCSQPCTQIKLTSVSEPQEISYKLYFHVESTISIILGSSEAPHTISMTCGKASTLVQPNFVTQKYSYYENTTVRMFEFEDFICSETSCCTQGLNYTIVSSNTLPLTANASLATVYQSTSSQFTLDSFDMSFTSTSSIYIYAVNNVGSYGFSDPIYVTVRFNCLMDEVFYMSKTIPPPVVDTISSWSKINKRYRLKVRADFVETGLTGYSVDLSGRFQELSKSDSLGCQISGYVIDKVVERATQAKISHSSLFSLNYTTGVLNITNFDSAYLDYQIFVSAFNGYVWSNSTSDGYLVQMSIIDRRIVLPKTAPQFTESLEDVKLIKGNLNKVTYIFPSIYDVNTEESQAIEIIGADQYPFIDFKNEKLMFDQQKIETTGEFTIYVVLKDSADYKTEYELKIQVIEPFVPSFEFQRTKKDEEEAKEIVEDELMVEEQQEVEWPIVIWVKKLSHDGQMTLRFNQQLKIPDLDKIEPFYEVNERRLLQQKGNESNQTSLGDIIAARADVDQHYTVYLEEWAEHGMILQFNFSSPLDVSNGGYSNAISFSINNGSYFVATRSRLSLDDQLMSIDIKESLPTQLPHGVSQDELEQTSAIQENVLKALLVVQIVGAILLKGSKDKLMSLISVLQIIVYLPIYKAQIPANLQIFLKALRKVAEFKIVEEETIFDLLGVQNPFKNYDLTAAQKFKQQAYQQAGTKSFSILENMGYIIILMGLLLVFSLIMGLIFAILKSKRRIIKKKVKAAAKAFFWNGFVQTLNLTYLKSFVSFALATKLIASSVHFQFDVSLVVTILLGSLLIIQPFFTGVFMIKNRSQFKDKDFSAKFQSLYNDLQVREVAQLLYPMIFLIRRAIFVLSATIQDKYPCFQIQFLNLFNCFYFIFIGYVKPQKTRKSNRLELLNEFTVQILCYHLFCYTDWVHISLQHDLGVSFITIVLALMAFNITVMSPELWLPLKKKIYHERITRILFKLKKQQELEEQQAVERKQKAAAKLEAQQQKVRYHNFEDFKKRFPTKEEAQKQIEEKIQRQSENIVPKIQKSVLTPEQEFEKKKLDEMNAIRQKERAVLDERRKIKNQRNIDFLRQQMDNPKNRNTKTEITAKSVTTQKFKRIFKKRAMQRITQQPKELATVIDVNTQMENYSEPSERESQLDQQVQIIRTNI